VVPLEEKLPVKGHRVIVVCKDFKRIGYLDENGTWHDDAKSRELRQGTGWAEIGQ